MAITDLKMDQAYSDLKSIYGGVRNDYFGLLYMEQEFDLEREVAANLIAFGNNDYGIDGFHFDLARRNLYLFQFKYSEIHAQFKQSFQRLIDAGMERIFGATWQDQQVNQLMQQLKSCLVENQSLVDRICIHFVFMGDPAEAERSQLLDKLREDLENKKYLVDQYFGRQVTLVIEFRSGRTRKVGASSHVRRTHTYPLHLAQVISRTGPNGEIMQVGFVRLLDMLSMYKEMGLRFFDRNIRAALPEEESVNRSLTQAFKRIVLDEKDAPAVFPFNHNGITLSAESLDSIDGSYKITEPRLLNGAQTITTLARFLRANEGNSRLESGLQPLEQIVVLCKVVTSAQPEFITTVTVNNNCQNPVEPWNLRANDQIQLEIQDKLQDDLHIYYERQENAFASLSDDDLDERGITEYKAIELRRLAQTFLITDGEIDKLQRFRDVFEDDKLYAQVFNQARLKADSRKILLCYKVQFRLRRLLNDIVEKGANKYAYIHRARNLLWALLCQGILNDTNIESHADSFGHSLSLEADYTNWLSRIATSRCRFLISDLVEDKPYAAKAAEGNFSFLRTNAAYSRCMDQSYKRWKWVQKRLK